jgi:hypothetical protein
MERKTHYLGFITEAWLARAELNWSNLHAGPDFAEPSSRQAAYAPLRRDVHAEVEKLTGGSIPAPFHSFSFEASVLDRNAATQGFLRIQTRQPSSAV